MKDASPQRRTLVRWLFVLGALHVVVLCAGPLSPHPPERQDRDLPLAPPTLPRWVDAEGAWHLWPVVHPLVADAERFGVYRADAEIAEPLRLWAPSEPYRWGPFVLRHRLLGVDAPAKLHLLGTDRFGRDVFSRLLHGARLSLLTGLAAALSAVFLGLVLGAWAGARGGWVDAVIMRGAELGLALPWLYLLLAVRAFLPLRLDPGQVFLTIMLLVGALAWPVPARLVRGEVAAAARRGAVLASRGFGAGRRQILLWHLVPAALSVAWVQATILIPRCVVAEVTLSFLGLGVLEPAPSLGTLLAPLLDLGVVTGRPWLAAPAALLAVVTLSYHRLAHAAQSLAQPPAAASADDPSGSGPGPGSSPSEPAVPAQSSSVPATPGRGGASHRTLPAS